MFETWRRFGVPLASEGSPTEPPDPVPPVPHCTPASPWDASSCFPCEGEKERKEERVRELGVKVIKWLMIIILALVKALLHLLINVTLMETVQSL